MLFPRLQKRGPIEALYPCRHGRMTSLFPSLQKRGPIEATARKRAQLVKITGFHAYKSVAPLKRADEEIRMEIELVSTLTKAWPH